MKCCVYSFTAKGSELSEKLNRILTADGHECVSFSAKKYADVHENIIYYGESLKECVENQFHAVDLMIFIGATGIAVRSIAPFIEDKTSDPAVLCIDEKGENVISLLSGHIGGANTYAEYIAKAINSRAVISTATDINGLFAVDVFAKDNNLHILDMELAKKVSSLILENQTIPLCIGPECNDTALKSAIYKDIEGVTNINIFDFCIGQSHRKR